MICTRARAIVRENRLSLTFQIFDKYVRYKIRQKRIEQIMRAYIKCCGIRRVADRQFRY